MKQIPNTLTIGKVLHELNQIDSTNLYAKQLIAKSKPLDGTVIITDNQTQGRGQFGNSWQSAPGKNIALSVILNPNTFVHEQFYISKMASLACVEALKSITNLDFEIKWPNDIYYKKQKVGGMLIENQLSGNTVSNSVIGIGINLNQENFENLPSATSIYNLVKYLLSRKKCTEILLQALDVEYIKLRQNKFSEIDERYYQYLKDYLKDFQYMEDGIIKSGVLQGVLPSGQLKVMENGQEKTFDFKEIEWVL